MISFIEGALSECGIFHSVVNVNGIGYFVNMPLTVSSKMPAIGSKVKLYTYIVYREDKQDMYGFLSKEERDFFKLVVEKVSGVGPKTTLNLMSKLSLSIIKNAIESRDLDILAKCHGIGKKSAERIIMELSDKNLHNEETSFCPDTSYNIQHSLLDDAVSALVSLGYKQSDAYKAVKKASSKLGQDTDLEQLIKAALN